MEEIEGHYNSFSSDRGMHHLFDYLLAFKMMGSHMKETSTAGLHLSLALLILGMQ